MSLRVASPRPVIRRRLAGLFVPSLLAVAVACGEAASERDRERADLEAEFGRRAAPETEGAPADEPREATETAPPSVGETAEPGGEEAGETGPRPDPAVPGSDPPRTDPETGPGDPPTEAETLPAEPPTPAPTTSGRGVDIDSLLAVAETAYSRLASLRAAFVQRVEVPLLERTAEGRGTWYQRGRDLFRMDFEDPPDDVFVADGTFLWLFQPSQQPGQVIKSPLAAGTVETGTADLLGRLLSEARTSYDGVYAGAEPIDGVPTHHLTLTPRGPSDFREVEVWIASGDALVRRFRIVEENETIRTVTLSRLEPQVPLADSLFAFEPPPGAQVFER